MLEHPSPLILFPSSHSSSVALIPSPHTLLRLFIRINILWFLLHVNDSKFHIKPLLQLHVFTSIKSTAFFIAEQSILHMRFPGLNTNLDLQTHSL
jgi:hypothetical protein